MTRSSSLRVPSATPPSQVLALMGRDALRAAPAPAAPPPRDLRGDLAQAQVTLSQVTADRDALAREMDKLRMELQRVRDEVRALLARMRGALRFA